MPHKKSVLIIGGAGPIGTALADLLASSGHHVAIIDPSYKHSSMAYQVNRNIRIESETIEYFDIDAREPGEMIKVRNLLNSRNLQISGLVCMAALNPPMDSEVSTNELLTMDLSRWRNEIDVSLTSAFVAIQIFGKEFVSQKNGSIVLVSSDLGLIGPDQRIYQHLGNVYKSPAYTTAKHALIGLCHHIATTWAHLNIRCNVVAPGPVGSNISTTLSQELCFRIPLGRLATPKEIASSIRFLLSEESSFVTGATLVVDGGRTVW